MGRAGGGAGVPEVSGWQVGCRGVWLLYQNGSGGRGARGV
jgi:hypothetical protein